MITVIGVAERAADGRFRVSALCDCGNIFESQLRHIESGAQKSCGCSKVKHGLDSHPLANIWRCMKARCHKKSSIMYYRYGGRGITICDEWLNLENFVSWAESNGYKHGLQIDRIDNDGNYEPKNCRFVTCRQQQRNKNNTVYVFFNGEKWCLADLAEKYSHPYDRVYQRIFKLGWSVEKAILKPPAKTNRKTS